VLGLEVGLGASLLSIVGCRCTIPRDRVPVAGAWYTTFIFYSCICRFVESFLAVSKPPTYLFFCIYWKPIFIRIVGKIICA